MQHIPDNGNFQAFESALVLTDGQHVQHRLGGMGVAAVTGIDDGNARGHTLGYEMRRAALGMTHYEHIRSHGLQIKQGIGQGFTLGGS